MRKVFFILSALWCVLFLTAGLAASMEQAGAAQPEGNGQAQSMTEVNKQLSNPVTGLWSLSFQQNNYYLQEPPAKWQSNLQFQPVLPVSGFPR